MCVLRASWSAASYGVRGSTPPHVLDVIQLRVTTSPANGSPAREDGLSHGFLVLGSPPRPKERLGKGHFLVSVSEPLGLSRLAA
jgi:hypothetical protein